MCGHIFCRNCSGISASEIRALTVQTRVITYYCTDCLVAIRGLIKDLPRMKNQIGVLCVETEELKQKVGANLAAPTYAQVAADTEILRDRVEKLNETVNRQKPSSELVVGNGTIEPTLLEIRERERRASNILIFGAKESEANTEGPESDLKMAIAVIKSVKDSTGEIDIKVNRLGKRADGKVRPLRVTFSTPTEAKQVLRAKNTMKRDDGIYIKADQTPMQRTYLRELLGELEDRKSKGETNLKIRYVNNVPRLVKLKGPTPAKN